MTSGRVMNLITNDVGKFEQAFIFAHYLWCTPIQVALVAVILWQSMGPAPLFAMTVFLVMAPLTGEKLRAFYLN